MLLENTQLTEEVRLLKTELAVAKERNDSRFEHMRTSQGTPKPPLHNSRTSNNTSKTVRNLLVFRSTFKVDSNTCTSSQDSNFPFRSLLY